MRSSTTLFPLLSAVLHLSTQVNALYFTSPQASTTWAVAAGESMTWHYQAGDATKGTLMLATDDASSAVVVAAGVDLRSEKLTFPSGIVFTPTSTGNYLLRFVNSDDPSYVYSSVGPFAIQSLGTLATITTSSTHAPGVTNPKASPSLTEGAVHGTTEPAVSTGVATKASASAPAPTISPLPVASTVPTTPPAASKTVPAPGTASSASDNNVATVVITASAVVVTSTNSSNSNASLATRLPASGTSSRSPTASSSTSSAKSVRVATGTLVLGVLVALGAL